MYMFNDNFHIYIPLNILLPVLYTTPLSSPNHFTTVYTHNIIYCECKTDHNAAQV